MLYKNITFSLFLHYLNQFDYVYVIKIYINFFYNIIEI